jgi:tRNA threonylcarbamoyladenosine biosynthesis protein TsaB
MVKNLLESLILTNEDIDAYAVSKGPGSYTGIRIGSATIKGLAFQRNKECIGVSTLEALAQNLEGFDGVICAVMDARREQVYAGAFLNGERIIDDQCILISDLIPMLEGYNKPIYFCGDGYHLFKNRQIANMRPTPELLIYQNAFSVGKVAYKYLKNGQGVSDEALRVEYLLKVQAEREREEKLQQNKNDGDTSK